jgi:hypothetical protein
MGRALTLMLATIVKVLPCWEMDRVEGIGDWLRRLKLRVGEWERCWNTPFLGRWVEWDVREMFPSIPKELMLESLDLFFDWWKATTRYRGTRREVFLSIHKRFRQFDRLGKGDPKEFHVLSWGDVRAFVEWDLSFNVLFRFGRDVWKQTDGVPIGGPMSAQLASWFCACQEYYFLLASKTHLWFGEPIRFRDNIIMLLPRDVSASEIRALLQKIYSLDLTIEQWGGVLCSLEAVCSMSRAAGMTTTTVGLTWKGAGHAKEDGSVKGWVQYQSLNARKVLRSMVPGALRKCVLYATSKVGFAHNLAGLCRKLTEYPRSWWLPKVKSAWHLYHKRKEDEWVGLDAT